MLLKQHTVGLIICVIQFLYKKFVFELIRVKLYYNINIYNYKNTKNKYTQYSHLPENKIINSMLLKQHTVALIICIIQLRYKIKMFSDRFMQILQSNFIIVSKSIIIKIQKINSMLLKQHTVPLIICINIKIQKTIILNIHSYLNNKKINPMLLKQHTVPSIICIIQL